MNTNCNRDPLTCHCDYHSGRIPEALPVLDLLNCSPQEFAARLDEAFTPLDPARPVIADGMRRSVQPGIVIDEEPARPVMSIVARWAAGIALVGAGAAVMYAEGQRQAMPGIGFAVGLSMLVGAVLLTLGRGRC